jgi:hypothetical protein
VGAASGTKGHNAFRQSADECGAVVSDLNDHGLLAVSASSRARRGRRGLISRSRPVRLNPPGRLTAANPRYRSLGKASDKPSDNGPEQRQTQRDKSMCEPSVRARARRLRRVVLSTPSPRSSARRSIRSFAALGMPRGAGSDPGTGRPAVVDVQCRSRRLHGGHGPRKGRWSEDAQGRRRLGASDLAIGTRIGVRLGSALRFLWVVIWSNP